MGFLKRFFRNTFRDGAARRGGSSFDNLPDEALEAHLNIARYGDFVLTDAVRPAFDLQVVPSSGYRRDCYQDRETGVKIPVVMASASRDQVLDVFFDAIDLLGHEVDVVLESSHERRRGHNDLYREQIDMPVLKSILYDFEDLLLNDGCLGIAVLNPHVPHEVQFDEHKLLIIYGDELVDFEDTLDEHGLDRRDEMKFITEAEHVHSSTEEYARRFEELRYRLGIDDE